MTALLAEVGDYLVRWAVWMAVLAILAVAAAAPVWLTLRRRVPVPLPTAALAAVTGALVIASLGHRFDIDGPTFDVWRHSLPWMWVAVGAVAGVAAATVRAARRA